MVTAPLSGRSEAVALDEPLLVVQLGPLNERQAQLLDRLEGPHPQQLLFEGADRALDAAVAFGSSYDEGLERRPRNAISFWKSSLMYCEP